VLCTIVRILQILTVCISIVWAFSVPPTTFYDGTSPSPMGLLVRFHHSDAIRDHFLHISGMQICGDKFKHICVEEFSPVGCIAGRQSGLRCAENTSCLPSGPQAAGRMLEAAASPAASCPFPKEVRKIASCVPVLIPFCSQLLLLSLRSVQFH
jgi:hypothetical protein